MSEHIQEQPTNAPSGIPPLAHPGEHERTPGVYHESLKFDFRLIIWVGVGLAIVALVLHFVVGALLGGLKKFNDMPAGSVSELALDDASQPLGQRVDRMPPPHLEGIERESSLLIVRTDDGEKKRFITSLDLRVRIGSKENAPLFELRTGQSVTLAYFMPGGVGGGLGVVSSITSPPVEAEHRKVGPELPEVLRTLNCTILKIEPRGIAEARDWAEVRRQSYGWIDREKGIVHIPVETAMEEVLRTREFESPKQSREHKRPDQGGK